MRVARMRREIEAAQLLGGNPHVMPVLDYSDRHDWFVMPLAGDTAADLAVAADRGGQAPRAGGRDLRGAAARA